MGYKILSGFGISSQRPALIDAQVFDAAKLDMKLNGNHSYVVADPLAARGVSFIFSPGYSGRDMSEGYRDRQVLKMTRHLSR
jgi:hypothetical protein